MDYNARYYDPQIQQFISADTIVPQSGNVLSWNRYAYVDNNPINYNDPTGHCDMPPAIITPWGLVEFYNSCFDDIDEAIDSYMEGERNARNLILEGTGLSDGIIWMENEISNLNTDMSLVFSDAPLADRIVPSIEIGLFAVGTAATIVGPPSPKSTGLDAAEELRNMSTPSSRSSRTFENNLTNKDAINWFNRIADPNSVGPHRNPNVPGGLSGKVRGTDYYVGYRPFSSSKPSAPTIDIHGVPGWVNNTEIKFKGVSLLSQIIRFFQ